jgi:CRP-like cAMP-binding protein
MELEDTAELLGRVPIFQGLTPAQLINIVSHGREVFFEFGDALLRAGERGDTAYLVLAGFVAPDPEFEAMVSDEVLGQGTFLGELAMLVDTTFTVTVTARWNMCAFALSRDAMYIAMEEDPGIAHHFAGKLFKRLQHLATDIRRAETRFECLENSLQDVLEQDALENAS